MNVRTIVLEVWDHQAIKSQRYFFFRCSVLLFLPKCVCVPVSNHHVVVWSWKRWNVLSEPSSTPLTCFCLQSFKTAAYENLQKSWPTMNFLRKSILLLWQIRWKKILASLCSLSSYFSVSFTFRGQTWSEAAHQPTRWVQGQNGIITLSEPKTTLELRFLFSRFPAFFFSWVLASNYSHASFPREESNVYRSFLVQRFPTKIT